MNPPFPQSAPHLFSGPAPDGETPSTSRRPHASSASDPFAPHPSTVRRADLHELLRTAALRRPLAPLRRDEALVGSRSALRDLLPPPPFEHPSAAAPALRLDLDPLAFGRVFAPDRISLARLIDGPGYLVPPGNRGSRRITSQTTRNQAAAAVTAATAPTRGGGGGGTISHPSSSTGRSQGSGPRGVNHHPAEGRTPGGSARSSVPASRARPPHVPASSPPVDDISNLLQGLGVGSEAGGVPTGGPAFTSAPSVRAPPVRVSTSSPHGTTARVLDHDDIDDLLSGL